MKWFVTGGAGFIGSHFVDALIARNEEVTVYDNLTSGNELNPFRNKKAAYCIEDVLNSVALHEEMKGHDIVAHFAANPDASVGVEDPYVDLNQETVATYNVLEAMRDNGVERIVFSSSGTIYGDHIGAPLAEDSGPVLPISMYGAGKLASEGLISAFCHTFDMQSWIFRFSNIVGPRATHGVIVDFIYKLKRDPTRLDVLGDGFQRKPYLHVKECIEGMLVGITHAADRVNVFNLGCHDTTNVRQIAGWVIEEMGLKDVKIYYGKEFRGWPGDVPQVRLNCEKINKLGWKARCSSDSAVRQAIMELVKCR